MDVLERDAGRHPRDAPGLVPDAIEDRLTEVRLKRAFVTRLEGLEVLQQPNNRVLHDVRGIQQVARAWRQSAARPPAKGRSGSRQQRVDGLGIAGATARQ